MWEIECGHGVVSTSKMRRVALLGRNQRNRKNVTVGQITIFVKWGYEKKPKLTLIFFILGEKC